MRAVYQRVFEATVATQDCDARSIGRGLLLFLGVEKGDTEEEADWLLEKVLRTRCFEDDEDRMNLSLQEIGGDLMVISQFTLFGSLRKGTRPSFNRSAEPAEAERLYDRFARMAAERLGRPVPTGFFARPMRIEAANDGPVTLVLDTKRKDF